MLKEPCISETGPRDTQARIDLKALSLRIYFHGTNDTVQASKQGKTKKTNNDTYDSYDAYKIYQHINMAPIALRIEQCPSKLDSYQQASSWT